MILNNNLTYEIKITGIVQGVGFRPHVYRCAQLHQIKGYVLNNNEGVTVYAQAAKNTIHEFLSAIKECAPMLSQIDHIASEVVHENQVYSTFTIANSETSAKRTLVTPPDAFVCEECLNELFKPNDRRYLSFYQLCALWSALVHYHGSSL